MEDTLIGPQAVPIHSLDAGQALMDHIPFPIMRIGADYEVQWMNQTALATYGDRLGPCYCVSHGRNEPCDIHGEVCPKRQVESSLSPVSVLHVHATDRGEQRYKVMAIPLQGGGILEGHIPLHDVGAVDSVTGLLTRCETELMATRVLALLRRQKAQFAILFLDIDHFKLVNDTYGHPVGDIVLGRIGQLITEELRKSDVVGRWGGEEFLALLPNIKDSDAEAIAERVLQRVRSDIFGGAATPIRVTLSGGLCIVPEGCATWDFHELVAAADKCMYKAKQAGRDRLQRCDVVD